VVVNFLYFEVCNILKRAHAYMVWAGAVVTQPEGGRFVLNHTPQPPLMASRWEAPDFTVVPKVGNQMIYKAL